MTPAQCLAHLRTANAVAARAKAAGHHPFGAILVAPDGETVLMEQGNINTVNHAESTLAREATTRYEAAYLWDCTLVTTVEPCAMCAGTQYWANIGTVVFGLEEKRLLALTGAADANPTMNLPCRTVFAAGQKQVTVIGPVTAADGQEAAQIEADIAELHRGFWDAP
jgi:tRNA(Arg) A34 adenosine deaminase TadA